MPRYRQYKVTVWVTPEEQKRLEYCALQNKDSKSGLIRRLMFDEFNRIQASKNEKKINKGLTGD